MEDLIDYGRTRIKAKEFIGDIEGVPASSITVQTFTTDGETEISGTLQEVLEAIADLADPAE